MTKRSKLPKAVVTKLPKKFQGADVLRGLGMKFGAFDAAEKKSLDQFDALRETFLVIADRALEEGSGGVEVRCFADKKTAIRYARARGHGNVDQRVLCVRGQTLVVATENVLYGL